MAYATPAQFVQAYGLRETAQLLQDERELLTEPLLDWALGVGTGTLVWSGYRAASPSPRASAQEYYNGYAWVVFAGGLWGAYAGPVGFGAPSLAQIAVADAQVQASIQAGDAGALRLLDALHKSSLEMDGYLRGVIALPIALADLPSMLLDECCYVLARCRLADDCDNRSDLMDAGCNDKRAWLARVAKGQITLVLPTGAAAGTARRYRSGRTASGFGAGFARQAGHTAGLLPEQHSPLANDQVLQADAGGAGWGL